MLIYLNTNCRSFKNHLEKENTRLFMPRFLFIVITVSFLSSTITLADFGPADIGDIELNRNYKFDAWCGKAKDDCKIEFEDDKIYINENDFVKTEQIQAISYNLQKEKCLTTKHTGSKCLIPFKRNKITIYITYLKRNGSISVARVIFKDIKTGESFLKTISSFTGIKAFLIDKNVMELKS